MTDDIITLDVTWEDYLMANVILLWSDSLLCIKLSKLFKKLSQRILEDFFMIIIFYF